jgi:integrase/recombinase XerD
VDLVKESIFVKEGKGGGSRYVPIGKRAIFWLEKYLMYVRPALEDKELSNQLFLGIRGENISIHQMGQIVKRYLLKAGFDRTGSCHMFRHSCATQMLENGADIRYIQQMLGHKDISSTQIYTQVSMVKLKEIHEKCHPAEVGR